MAPRVINGPCSSRIAGSALCLLSSMGLGGCNDKGPALAHVAPAGQDSAEFEQPDLGAANDPQRRIGALVDLSPIYVAAHKKAAVLGYLHAGETVARSEQAHENDQCTRGWYAVAPHGYVCTEQAATTDLNHPTLRAMGLLAQRNRPLPYTYAKTSQITSLYARGPNNSVKPEGRLGKGTVLAVVGSWTAPDESQEPQRLGLLTDGHFVRADDLRPLQASVFSGLQLNEQQSLPLGYVVRRGVSRWKLSADQAEKLDQLEYHERLALTGRFRTVQGERFWAITDESWVRHRDVTVIRDRHELPDFVRDGQKWIDISVITGIAVAYEGKKPVFATLVSVGRDRTGDPQQTASTARGTFRVVGKYLTRRSSVGPDAPARDIPWALELDNGQWLQAAPHHDRFGIEHTEGSIEVSPEDGKYLFNWSSPSLPADWHGVVVDPAEVTTIVEVRK